MTVVHCRQRHLPLSRSMGQASSLRLASPCPAELPTTLDCVAASAVAACRRKSDGVCGSMPDRSGAGVGSSAKSPLARSPLVVGRGRVAAAAMSEGACGSGPGTRRAHVVPTWSADIFADTAAETLRAAVSDCITWSCAAGASTLSIVAHCSSRPCCATSWSGSRVLPPTSASACAGRLGKREAPGAKQAKRGSLA